MKRYWPLAASILILQILAFMTSYFVTKNAVNDWYKTIEKSPLNPPDWLFAPVWTILYTFLGIALWRLWLARGVPGARAALAFFLMQLLLNYLWSPFFFGLAAFEVALGILVWMVGFTIACMVKARTFDTLVVKLMIPYLAWIGFATYLNWSIMVLNR